MIERWHVAFVELQRQTWWSRFLRPGFRHCFAFGFDVKSQRWILLDPKIGWLYARVCTGDELDEFATWALCNGRIVSLRAGERTRWRPRLVLTCVAFVAYLLGLPGGAWTPYRLYRQMLANGGHEWARVDG